MIIILRRKAMKMDGERSWLWRVLGWNRNIYILLCITMEYYGNCDCKISRECA